MNAWSVVRKVVWGGLALALVGCGGDKVPDQAPALQQLLVVEPGAAGPVTTDLLLPADASLGPFSPRSQLQLVFDRLLDPEPLESIDGGVVTGKADVATLIWLDAPAGALQPDALVAYSPGGLLDARTPGPSLWITPQPALPAGAHMKLTLARSKFRSKSGQNWSGGPDSQLFDTAPFAVDLTGVPASVGSKDSLTLTFNSLPAMDVLTHIHVTADGQAVPVVVMPSEEDAALFAVRSQSPDGWQGGLIYTLSVDREASDLFGVSLGGQGRDATFAITPLP